MVERFQYLDEVEFWRNNNINMDYISLVWTRYIKGSNDVIQRYVLYIQYQYHYIHYIGEVSCPMCTKPAKATCQVIATIAAFCGSTLCNCLSRTTTNLAWGAGVAARGKDRTKYIGREGLVSKNAKRPINCDGMCRGAKQARRIHRKKIRLLKRRGAKTEKMVAWWEKSYNCTCVVKLETIKSVLYH